ncbi:MAG: MOSC domain-containing protein [Notoacmeibacter sp.]
MSSSQLKEPSIVPARKLEGRVDGLLVAAGKDFITAEVSSLNLTLEGIADDHHSGLTRKAGGREPWYPRGTIMRNERQISLVAFDELQAAALEMGLSEIKPEWVGANIVIGAIANFTMLPPRTLLFFEGGVTIKIDGQNAPCRSAGKAIAAGAGVSDNEGMALSFKDAAKRRRGLVGWVEKPGVIETGAKVTARLPEQWIYS